MSNQDRVKRWIKPTIQRLNAYHVADAKGFIKLDAMENPYQCSEEMQQQYLAELSTAQINRYPDPSLKELKRLIKQVLQIPDDLQLLFGNGSDEIIQIIITAVAEPGRVIMAPEPSFVMYKMLTELLGLTFVGVPLRDDFSLDEFAMIKAIEQYDPAVVFLAYPNNPTGNLFDSKVINTILHTTNGLVVIDEAYHIFSGVSYLDQIMSHENLLVMRTLSKAGLAGLRFGFLVGPDHWLYELDKVRLPYNINSLTQTSMGFYLQHYDLLEQQADAIQSDRNVLFKQLNTMGSVDVRQSSANFLLFRCLAESAEEVFNGLYQQKILIKKLHGSHPLLENCLRVTVGKPDENIAFMTAIKQILS